LIKAAAAKGRSTFYGLIPTRGQQLYPRKNVDNLIMK
jgi:hypothetical protein